jgi:serine protease AprX
MTDPHRRIAIPLLPVIGLLLLLPVLLLADEPWKPLPKENPVLSDELVARGKVPGAIELKAWVFFTDKGILSAKGYSEAIERAERNLHPKARARREKMGREGALVGYHDLGLSQRYVDGVLATGAKDRALSRYLNGMSVEAPLSVLEEIARLPFVRHVRPVRAFSEREVSPDGPPPARPAGKHSLYNLDYGSSLGQVEMMQVPALHDQGYDGTGVRICLLDTGFKRTHDVFGVINVVAEWDFINDDGNTAFEPGDPSDQHSHGTLILSLIGGYLPGELIGPAYGAEFLLGKTEDTTQEQPIEEDWWVEGIEWADGLGADIVSSSLGYNDWYTYADMDGNTATTTIAADLAAWNGILVCVSAGNEGGGSWNYIIAPADADSIIATGAVWSDTTLAYFSSRGPTSDGRIKPDLVAQGVYTHGADPYDDHFFTSCHGTSCSNPLLAGAAALLLDANPSWNPQDLIAMLKATATQSSAPDTAMGWGLIQAADALAQVTGVLGSEEEESAPPAAGKGIHITASPNPFNPTVTLTVAAEKSASLTVQIMDARGRLVRTLLSGDLPAGEHQMTWDGKDRNGADVPSGVYFAHARGAGAAATRKISLIR